MNATTDQQQSSSAATVQEQQKQDFEIDFAGFEIDIDPTAATGSPDFEIDPTGSPDFENVRLP